MCLYQNVFTKQLVGLKLERCSVVRTLFASVEDLGLVPSHPHAGSQLSVTLVSGDMRPSSNLHGTRHTHDAHTFLHMN